MLWRYEKNFQIQNLPLTGWNMLNSNIKSLKQRTKPYIIGCTLLSPDQKSSHYLVLERCKAPVTFTVCGQYEGGKQQQLRQRASSVLVMENIFISKWGKITPNHALMYMPVAQTIIFHCWC